MMKDKLGGATGRNAALLLMLSLTLSACALHWPWHRRAHPPPQPVQQVSIAADASGSATTILQYWDRNTLLLDLTAAAGEGGAIVTPIKALGWPVRLEFRVQPGSIGRLEVQGAQRVVYEIPAQGAALLLKLAPSAYHPDTAQITLRWSAAGDSAH
jgi:hypothetical protein